MDDRPLRSKRQASCRFERAYVLPLLQQTATTILLAFIFIVALNFPTEAKSKAVPLHAMVAPGDRGGIAPTHS
jgi:hypothetical protein